MDLQAESIEHGIPIPRAGMGWTLEVFPSQPVMKSLAELREEKIAKARQDREQAFSAAREALLERNAQPPKRKHRKREVAEVQA